MKAIARGKAGIIKPTNVEGLLLAPATTDLSSADIEMMAAEKRSFLLHDALRQPAIDDYELDYVRRDFSFGEAVGEATYNAFAVVWLNIKGFQKIQGATLFLIQSKIQFEFRLKSL